MAALPIYMVFTPEMAKRAGITPERRGTCEFCGCEVVASCEEEMDAVLLERPKTKLACIHCCLLLVGLAKQHGMGVDMEPTPEGRALSEELFGPDGNDKVMNWLQRITDKVAEQLPKEEGL